MVFILETIRICIVFQQERSGIMVRSHSAVIVLRHVVVLFTDVTRPPRS